MECHSLIIDKIDLHLALDFQQDLKALSEFEINPQFKTLLTTNVKQDEQGVSNDSQSYKEIKKAFMGDNKALIIQVNED